MPMTLTTSDFQGMTVQEFDTTKLLSHAARQSRDRNLQDYFIADVDSHHFETESMAEILDYIEDPVMRQLAKGTAARGYAAGLFPGSVGFQDMGGRVSRYPLRGMEKTPPGIHRDVTLATRWMDAMAIDIALMFPTPMLLLGSHPLAEVEVQLSRAYTRWLLERVLPEEPRLRTLVYLPFNDPEASYKAVLEFGGKPGVSGFLVTATHNLAIHDNAFMKTYRAIEELGLPIAFHGSYNWNDKAFATANRFISVHALGFVFYNMLHMTNWIMNGLPERFPKLKVIWMESGLAWVPFMMQRLDNEYMMRSNEAPSLKMRPSDYMRKMYYSTQPMEMTNNLRALELTFEMIDAETQLMYSSDYPHWDFDLPSTIFDLPFLSEKAKRNIIGETARSVFRLDVPAGKKLAQIPPA
jgi:uncharacterized protein